MTDKKKYTFQIGHGGEGNGLSITDEWDREVIAEFKTKSGKKGTVKCFSVSDGNLGYTARCCGLGALQKFSIAMKEGAQPTGDEWFEVCEALADALSKKKLQYDGQKASQFIMSGQEGSFQNEIAKHMPGLVFAGPTTMNHRWHHVIQTFIWVPTWASKSGYTKVEKTHFFNNTKQENVPKTKALITA